MAQAELQGMRETMGNRLRLEGKRALATAAGQGIGRATAIAMADEGAKVFATDINEKALADLAALGHPNIETFVLDAAKVIREEFMARDPSSINFNVTALCKLDD